MKINAMYPPLYKFISFLKIQFINGTYFDNAIRILKFIIFTNLLLNTK